LSEWAPNWQPGRSNARRNRRACDRGSDPAPIVCLVKATKKPDQHENRDRHSNQPKKHIASHRRFSLLQKGTRHVSASSRHIASVNREWIVERMHWPRIDSRHGKPAIEVANQYWRGKNDEPESKPEARPTAAGWPTGRPGEARSAAARWPEARPAAARRTAGRTAEPAEPLIR